MKKINGTEPTYVGCYGFLNRPRLPRVNRFFLFEQTGAREYQSDCSRQPGSETSSLSGRLFGGKCGGRKDIQRTFGSDFKQTLKRRMP